MPKIALIGGLLLLLFVLFVGVIWIFQERIAFQPPRAPYPGDPGVPRVEYAASDGQQLFGYLVGETSSSSGLLIAFHGNADLAVRQVEWAREVLRRSGTPVLLAEYRGYMGLGGSPNYESSQLDAEAAYQFAVDNLKVPGEGISFFGHSMGTAIATELAIRHEPASVLLQSPFTSARDMAGIMVGRRPTVFTWNLVSRLHFDTQARVAKLGVPVSVAHGADDRLIPSSMGRAVFDAAKVKGSWLLVPIASHNNVAVVGAESYWSWLIDALPARKDETAPLNSSM